MASGIISNDVVGETAATLVLLRLPMSSHGSAAAVCKRWAAIVKSAAFRTARRVGGFTEYGILVAGGTNGLTTPYAEGWLRVGERWRTIRAPPRVSLPHFNVSTTTGVDIGGGRAAFLGFGGRVKVYDVALDSWTDLPHWGTARHCAGLAYAGGELIVIGGRASTHVGSIAYDTCIAYNFESEQWTSLPSMPFAIHGPAAVGVIDDKVYVVGGWKDWGLENKLQIYCLTTRTWTLGRSMVAGRCAAGAAVRNGRLYVIGGEIERSDEIYVCPLCQFYVPEEDKWYYAPYLPSGRPSCAACVQDDTIFFFGSGGTQAPRPPLTYGLDSDKWDWEAIAESDDYFSDTESGNEGRGRMREILESAELGYHADADSADEWDVGVYNESFRNRIKDERWWCVRGGEECEVPDGRYYHLGDNMLHRVGHAADRRTRKAWKELPGCPPALHRISSPAVVTLELG